MFNPPKQLVILYGPPGSGKGTQGELLKAVDYAVISSGDAIREFTKQSHTEPHEIALAQRVNTAIDHGELIDFDDLNYIVGERFKRSFETHNIIFLEGIPRRPKQAQWLIDFAHEHEINIAFMHLKVGLAEVLERNSNRYYVPGSHVPYMSFDEALYHCPGDVQPIQRNDDKDTNIIRKRYQEQYQDSVQQILEVFEKSEATTIHEIDASQKPHKIYHDILRAF
jgi:adenylate kinase